MDFSYLILFRVYHDSHVQFESIIEDTSKTVLTYNTTYGVYFQEYLSNVIGLDDLVTLENFDEVRSYLTANIASMTSLLTSRGKHECWEVTYDNNEFTLS